MSNTKFSCRLAIAALGLLAASSVPGVGQPGWRSRDFPPPNGGFLVYRLIGGNPACASYNGRECLWGVGADRIQFSRVRPLICGADHRDKWGVTGYENPSHWCNLARSVRID
jgi:hypothetical protein